MKNWRGFLAAFTLSATILAPSLFVFSQQAHAASPAPSNKIVYLTFDDGPSRYTADIVNALNCYNAKATFFMIEPHVRQYPDAARYTVKSGNSVGSHSVSHIPSIFYHSAASVVSEMQTTRETIKKVTGVDSNLIRTPYGSKPYMSPSYFTAVHNVGFRVFDWTIDSFDWKYCNSAYVGIVESQLTAMQKRNKPLIILMHDRHETARSLPQLLAWLKANGYQMQVISSSTPEFHFQF